MSIESINTLDEAKILGYFESIKSVFLLKLVLLTSVVKDENGKRFVDPNQLRASAIAEVKAEIDDPLFYKALMKGNEELCQNFLEDMVTSLVSTSWVTTHPKLHTADRRERVG